LVLAGLRLRVAVLGRLSPIFGLGCVPGVSHSAVTARAAETTLKSLGKPGLSHLLYAEVSCC
jgi:hypothetical protein